MADDSNGRRASDNRAGRVAPGTQHAAGGERMNLETIARLAGVSRSTVSRVINDDARVSPEARARVQAVIEEHDYHPNAAARSLASRRTGILGLMIPRSIEWVFGDLFFQLIIKSITLASNDAGQNLMLLMESAGDREGARRLFNRVVGGRHLDGVVVVSNVIEEPLVELLDQHGFPAILVGRHPLIDLSYVDVDNRTAAREGVEHLIAHGHRRIAMIGGAPNLIATVDRRDGYHQALFNAGIPVDPDLYRQGDFREMIAYTRMRELLALTDSDRPTAVFTASDAMAFGAMRAITDGGRSVPGDIAVMGFDGIEQAAHASPPLSTIAQPVELLGREAVAMLLQRIETPDVPPMHRVLPTELQLRASCGCHPASAAPALRKEVAAPG
jgi:LacI family transcriptional regulator